MLQNIKFSDLGDALRAMDPRTDAGQRRPVAQEICNQSADELERLHAALEQSDRRWANLKRRAIEGSSAGDGAIKAESLIVLGWMAQAEGAVSTSPTLI